MDSGDVGDRTPVVGPCIPRLEELSVTQGTVEVATADGKRVEMFSEKYGCAVCGISLPELEPRHFSFNSPFGACTSVGCSSEACR